MNSSHRIEEMKENIERCKQLVEVAQEQLAELAKQPQGERAMLSGSIVELPEGLHPDTADLVIRFATALAEKLHVAETKYGHANGWMADGWYDECLQQLWEHVEKGDPRDVAAYCAFMWHHGWVTDDYDRGVPSAITNLRKESQHGKG